MKCKMCSVEVSAQAHELAGYKVVVGDDEVVFCCKSYQEDYKKKKIRK